MVDRALAAAVATECHDQVVMDAVATQHTNYRNLWAAIESAGHPDDVDPELWRAALDTEQLIAEHNQAAIEGCPCPQHGEPTWTTPTPSPSRSRPHRSSPGR